MPKKFDLASLTAEDFDHLTDEQLAEAVSLLEKISDDWVLTPHQAKADSMADECDELMFGGSAGAGKTEVDLFHVNRWSKKIPHHRTLMLRSSFPELRRTLIARSLIRLTGKQSLVDGKPAHFKVADKEWHYTNGSVIEFGFCDTFEDTRHFLSAEYDLIVIDESTDFTQEQIELLRSRLRTTQVKRRLGCHPHLFLSTNPGGIGHGFHKARYVIPTNYGKAGIVEIPDNPDKPEMGSRKIAFVPSRVGDNPHIDPQYVSNLQAISDPIKRAQYLDGSWDTFEGQFFEEWDRGIHVIPPFPIPATWTKIRGIDYGTGKPFACEWIAFDWDGNAYFYKERYGAGLTATEQARMVLEADVETGDDIAYSMADPSIWARTAAGDSIAAMYRKAGLVCRKADNARADGWNVMREYMRGALVAAANTDDPDAANKHPAGARLPEGVSKPNYQGPAMYIFEGMCPNLVRELPELLRDPRKPEDCINDPHKTSDHACDGGRYGLQSRPRRPRMATAEERWTPGRHADQIAKQRDRDRRRNDVLGSA